MARPSRSDYDWYQCPTCGAEMGLLAGTKADLWCYGPRIRTHKVARYKATEVQSPKDESQS